jgi:prepilin-type N-terminal cleavage/methylation domain-containing protein
MTTDHRARSGLTLLEMIVTLAVLALTAAVTSIAIQPTPKATKPAGFGDSISLIQERSILTGRPITIVVESPNGPRPMTVLPDGRVFSVEGVRVGPTLGARREASR